MTNQPNDMSASKKTLHGRLDFAAYELDKHGCSDNAVLDAQDHIAKLETTRRPTKHDWVEDWADDDNGEYQHKCQVCDYTFIAHKRRGCTCKACYLLYLEAGETNE